MKVKIKDFEFDTTEKYECIKCFNGTIKVIEISRGKYLAKCDNPTCGFEQYL